LFVVNNPLAKAAARTQINTATPTAASFFLLDVPVFIFFGLVSKGLPQVIVLNNAKQYIFFVLRR
jgi:hypothetical protein